MATGSVWRFNFTAVRNWPGTADAIQLSEVRFYRANGRRHVFSPNYGASNPGGSNPWHQTARNLIDDSLATKWCAW